MMCVTRRCLLFSLLVSRATALLLPLWMASFIIPYRVFISNSILYLHLNHSICVWLSTILALSLYLAHNTQYPIPRALPCLALLDFTLLACLSSVVRWGIMMTGSIHGP